MSTRPLVVVLVDDGTSTTALCGRPAVDWLLDAVDGLGPASLAVTAGAATTAGEGDALARRTGIPLDPDAAILVLPCSLPLLRRATLRRAVASVSANDASLRATVLNPDRRPPWWAEPGDPSGPIALAVPGRLGLTADELAAMAVCPTGGGAARVRMAREQLAAAGARVWATRIGAVESLWLGDPVDRAQAENALYARVAAGWQERGVVIEDPASTRIDASVHLAEGVRIRPHTELIGQTVIGRNSTVGPTTTVRDCRVGEDCLIQYAVCQDTEVGDGANVGPFTWLRTGTRLGARCRAGAYVELADSTIGEGTSIPHLAGLFGADVGRNANFGSMSGPANFDGTHKHRSRFGDDVSIGSGTILVAPVSVGDRAATAAGSVITEDVPAGALALTRVAQRNITGWADRQRPDGTDAVS